MHSVAVDLIGVLMCGPAPCSLSAALSDRTIPAALTPINRSMVDLIQSPPFWLILIAIMASSLSDGDVATERVTGGVDRSERRGTEDDNTEPLGQRGNVDHDTASGNDAQDFLDTAGVTNPRYPQP
jgi:hypothetical protein